MKKIFLLSALAISAISFSFIGSDFEGKIVYTMSVDNANMPPEAKAMMQGSEFSIYMKGTKSRTDMNMMMQNTTTISDAKTKTSVTLVEVMGNKYKIKNDETKNETEKMPDVTVKNLDETKMIAGYKCKKAELTIKDKTGKAVTTNIYYCEEITNSMGHDKRSYQFKNIKGMPLEYEINADNGMKMKMTAKSVSKESVPDSKFEIPSGYKETTVEEMQKDMMKMMQGQ